MKNKIVHLLRKLLQKPAENTEASSNIVKNPTTIEDIIQNANPDYWKNNSYNFALAKLLSCGKELNSSILYDGGVFSTYYRVIERYMSSLPEKTLEVGPGRSLGASILLSMAGVKESHTLDPFPNLDFDVNSFVSTLQSLSNATFFIRQIIDGPGKKHIKAISSFQETNNYDFTVPTCVDIDSNTFKVGNCTVKHFPGKYFEETGLESNFYDFVFSHAALEHVRDPEKCVKEMARLLRTGGVTAHQIDLRYHNNFEKPLEFLKFSDELWKEKMEELCKYDKSLYMNRWRKSQWIESFKGNGFEIVEAETNMRCDSDKISELKPFMNEKFQNMEIDDIESIGMFLVARRI
jgi:SAM-dependent methyltransferase